MSTQDLQSMQEVIFDLSFEFGYRYNALTDQQASDLMDMLNGSRGLKDKIVAWAAEFDDDWSKRPEDEREEYLGDVDEFAKKKWGELLGELMRFNPIDGTMRPADDTIMAVQVVPVCDVGKEVIAQFSGPDADTTAWGIYTRGSDGLATHVADVHGADNYDTAMLMGRCLAIEHKVQIESQPWIVPAKVELPELDFRVVWEIDVSATSPREAAEKAREIQYRIDSTATVFDVRRPNSKSVRIDLSEATDA